ncbi:hypothetical protein ACTVD7_005558 [Pseudomonas aeruginosa]|uniref:Uncharacterized protein n=3 Tax=Pseudomonas TaxID=286 RepID=A0A223Q493_PSEPU|nr:MULTISPECIES: hypothetical protein [Pseudomonas]EMZ43934.1 hypothetical protein HMPREF1223_13863 [Pseudomonas aeruginosa str. Stone 130]AJA17213.1 hypothetical protein RPPX_28215 [Pseudomonas putida S12]ASU52426.1 Hypothetical protein [Pseudomonas putida]AVE21751.1 Hypothetical protein [Pseudomonas aeruginosa]AVE22234.1 Hypothetical protein [Pseudomonas aeruginosa]
MHHAPETASLTAMTESQVLAWIDEQTCYSDLHKPTPSNLLYFARTRGNANLTDIDERRWVLSHTPAGYELKCLD